MDVVCKKTSMYICMMCVCMLQKETEVETEIETEGQKESLS